MYGLCKLRALRSAWESKTCAESTLTNTVQDYLGIDIRDDMHLLHLLGRPAEHSLRDIVTWVVLIFCFVEELGPCPYVEKYQFPRRQLQLFSVPLTCRISVHTERLSSSVNVEVGTHCAAGCSDPLPRCWFSLANPLVPTLIRGVFLNIASS